MCGKIIIMIIIITSLLNIVLSLLLFQLYVKFLTVMLPPKIFFSFTTFSKFVKSFLFFSVIKYFRDNIM